MSNTGILRRPDPSTTGLLLGTLSAAGYMVANLCLRSVADPPVAASDLDWAVWVSAVKAAPVALAAWILVGWRALRGLPALPPRHLVAPLIVTGFMMQWGGNVCFQFALSRAGLALTVPLCFATILVSAAIVGRVALGDPLTPATIVAVGVMSTAITVLAQGTEPADTPAASLTQPTAAPWTAAVAACLSGVAYGGGGVMIRRCVRGDLSHSATIVVLSTTGLLTLGGSGLLRIGPAQILATPINVWINMVGAGVTTALAFFAISGAYRHLSAVRVNLLNASQIAMSALAGVILFHEPNTPWLQAGTALTIIGLIFSARGDAAAREPALGATSVIRPVEQSVPSHPR